MKGEKDPWDLIFFLNTSSKESETEIFIAVYVSGLVFFPSKRDHAIFGNH